MELPLTDDAIVLAQAGNVAKRGLFKAIEDQNIAQVEMQLDFIKNVLKIKPDFVNAFGETPLVVAIKLNSDKSDQITELLIQAGADVNKADLENLDTPLHLAVKTANASIAQKLIFAGADITKLNRQRVTPSLLLSNIVRWLRQNGDPNNQIRLFRDLHKLLQAKAFQGS